MRKRNKLTVGSSNSWRWPIQALGCVIISFWYVTPVWSAEVGIHIETRALPSASNASTPGNSTNSSASGVFRPASLSGVGPLSASGAIAPFECRNLTSAVCGGSGLTFQERESTANQIGRNLVNAYIGSIGGRFTGIFNAAMRGAIGNPLFRNVAQGYFSFVANQLERSGFHLLDIIRPIRDSVIKSLWSQKYSYEDTREMQTTVERLSYRIVPDFNDPQMVRAYFQACGFAGLSPSAFAITERHEVVICPGMILRAIATARALGKGGVGSVVESVFHVVAHETCHHIGADRDRFGNAGPFKEVHTERIACMRTSSRFGDRIGPRQDGEAIADTCADEAMRVFSTDRPKPWNGKRTFDFARSALFGLCGGEGDSEHPDGATRIQLAGDSLNLGCSNSRGQCLATGEPGGPTAKPSVQFASLAPSAPVKETKPDRLPTRNRVAQFETLRANQVNAAQQPFPSALSPGNPTGGNGGNGNAGGGDATGPVAPLGQPASPSSATLLDDQQLAALLQTNSLVGGAAAGGLGGFGAIPSLGGFGGLGAGRGFSGLFGRRLPFSLVNRVGFGNLLLGGQ